MPVHVSAEELADAAAGLLDLPHSDQVAAHLADCLACRDTDAGLRRVGAALAAAPAPAMPAAVAARLDAVVSAESARRQQGGPGQVALGQVGTGSGGGERSGSTRAGAHGWSRVPLGQLEYAARPPQSGRWALAAGLAMLVGFGGYVVSAAAGLDDSPASVVAVDSRRLGRQAEVISGTSDLAPRRFSPGWACARRVTEGRITGVTPAVVDGTNALLVYTTADGATRVTVVVGCDEGKPVAGPSTLVPR